MTFTPASSQRAARWDLTAGFLALAFGAAAAGFTAANMASNASFAAKIGRAGDEAQVFVGVAILAEVIVALALSAVARNWRRAPLLSLFTAALWGACFVFSVCSAVGFVAAPRDQASNASRDASGKRAEAQRKIDSIQARIDALPRHGEPETIRAAMEATRVAPETISVAAWACSSSCDAPELAAIPMARRHRACNDVNAAEMREACAPVSRRRATLAAELAASGDAAKLAAELAAAVQARDAIPEHASEAIAQSAAVARALGTQEQTGADLMSWLFAIVQAFAAPIAWSLALLEGGKIRTRIEAPEREAVATAAVPPMADVSRELSAGVADAEAEPEASHASEASLENPPASSPKPFVQLPKRSTPWAVVDAWAEARIVLASGEAMGATEAYDDFVKACEANELPAISQQQFGRLLTSWCERPGNPVTKGKQGGSIVYVGCRISREDAGGYASGPETMAAEVLRRERQLGVAMVIRGKI